MTKKEKKILRQCWVKFPNKTELTLFPSYISAKIAIYEYFFLYPHVEKIRIDKKSKPLITLLNPYYYNKNYDKTPYSYYVSPSKRFGLEKDVAQYIREYYSRLTA